MRVPISCVTWLAIGARDGIVAIYATIVDLFIVGTLSSILCKTFGDC